MKSSAGYYTTEQVAALLAVKPKTVRAWIEQGELRALKLHRQWRIPTGEIDRLLHECRHAG